MYEFTANDYGTHDTWLMVLISSFACILGASVVFVDSLYSSSHCSSVLERPAVVASSMALGSGVMIFSALYTLLPASRARLESDYAVYCYYFSGILATLVITRTIHWMAPDAIHSHGEDHHHHHHPPFSESSSTSTTTTPTHEDEQVFLKSAPTETTRLIHWDEVEYGSRDPPQTIPENDYFRIGIQTAIAICIHKFPEGLIMFISGEASERLGLSVCAAMSIHNFIEGFMIALPLYFATKSRVRAFFYAALLGGMSQPLGAALGVVALDTVTQQQQDVLFGVTFGVVSGMMSLIAIQSMLPQAIKADPRQRYVSVFFFVGILLVGLASLLKSV